MGMDKMALTTEARLLLLLIVVQGDGRSANFLPVLGLFKRCSKWRVAYVVLMFMGHCELESERISSVLANLAIGRILLQLL